jgi:hypothetical protein
MLHGADQKSQKTKSRLFCGHSGQVDLNFKPYSSYQSATQKLNKCWVFHSRTGILIR